MATARPTRPAAAPRRPAPPKGGAISAAELQKKRRANTRLWYDLAGVALVACGAIILATFVFPPAHDGENLFGAAVTAALRLLVGSGAWAFPLILMLCGVMLCVGKNRSWDNVGGAVALFLIFVTWRHLSGPFGHGYEFIVDNLKGYGGYTGAAFSWVLRACLGTIGGHIALAALTITALLYLTDIPLPSLLGPVERLLAGGASAGTKAALGGTRRVVDSVREQRDLARERRMEEQAADADRAERLGDNEETETATRRRSAPRLFSRTTPEPIARGTHSARETDLSEPEAKSNAEKPARAPLFPVRKPDKPIKGAGEGGVALVSSAPAKLDKEDAPFVNPLMPRGPNPDAPALLDAKFVLPPLSLLKVPAPPKAEKPGESEARRDILLQTLEDFGVGADIADVAYGPAITRYEIALDRGIKVSKIVSLADNLAMALAAIDVRVEAPIPGKSAIGIEVPNAHPTTVTLRECIDRAEFTDAPSKLTFALGRDVTGVCRYADLAKMPHLLIGGSTGSGKSVGLNTLICSLLMRCSPRELKFLMIDPKKVELSLYEGIPHLAAPVITNVKQAPAVFKQALKEMENRYDRFAKAGTRNLEGYNSRVAEHEKLPYWVIVVDELADLMMTSGPEIETSICRLAQLSRATGIHLVIATQRPSVNVITGTIKANISSRIAFAVNSAVDSRTILDATGADRLIGRGDMLFMPLDAAKPQRIQGCFVSEQETEALVTYLKNQAQPNYEVLPSSLSLATGDDDSGETENESDDELFESAVKLVVTGGGASTSMLQRRFKIGYTRAARLVDQMEQRGIVGPLDGAKPREIKMSRDEVDAMFTVGSKAEGEE